MVKNILVFLPNTLQFNKNGYLEGIHEEQDTYDAFYVTNNNIVKHSDQIIGYVSNDAGTFKNKDFKGLHVDFLHSTLSLLNYGHLNNSNLVKIIYDYEAFGSCNALNSEHAYGPHFTFLSNYLKRKDRNNVENGRKHFILTILTFTVAVLNVIVSIFDSTKTVWSFSATISHFYDSISGYKWFLNEIIEEKRLSPKIGNFILSKILDIALGIALLQLCIENENLIVELIENVRETIINNFKELLAYLMGSPIGLKLNHAFNSSLGQFFFYHISLWRIFLITMHPTVKDYFKLLVLPGAFGFSYQVAMLSDFISLATFHVYCIYVYAARLIYMQLRGLLSLWRLFIGRKYNPLRTRVDSYQYSQHQLFIGTLGFTVLLFLLPTTTMYYTVFVIFRLFIMIVEEVLMRLRYLLQSLPLFSFLLWAVKSPNMAGSVCLRYKKTKDGIATFEARLKTVSFSTSVIKYAPYIIQPKTGLSWGKIFTGVVL